MKTRHLILILAACLPASVSAQLSDEALQSFQWFSTLGYPDVKDAKWAEIWTGRWSSAGGQDPPKADTIEGFIAKETDAEFTFVKSDLTSSTLKKTKRDTPAYERVGFEERPFLKMIGQQLAFLQHPPKDGFHRFGSRLGQKAERFFLAYVCWQGGEEDLAAQLYQAARLYDKESEKLPSSDSKTQKPRSMQEELEIDLGHAAMWDAVLRCGGWGGSEKLESRTALLEVFRRIVRLFPHCEHVELANQSAAILERMVKEDAQHPALAQEQIDHLPQDKRIAELVWMLRDQNGYQLGQPGWCDVFQTMTDGKLTEGKSPAHRLLDIGYPAVPALIEALTDGRFSRSVHYHRDFYFSHIVLTVGDCAQQILTRLTGQNFHSLAATSANMSNEKKMLEVQKAARKWWAEYQQKGKKQMLVDTIAAGQTRPDPLVEQLQAEAPEAVADALLRGSQKAQSPWMLRQFVNQLGLHKSPAATQGLLKLMKQNAYLEVRLDAAGHLLNQDHPEALPALLHEWGIYQTPAEDDLDSYAVMLELLIATGDVQAMRALASHWDDRPVHQRFEIVRKLGDRIGRDTMQYGFSFFKALPLSPKAKDEAMALLAHALEDLEACDETSGSMGEFSYNNPRICDFALWALHEIDGSQYAFSTQAGRWQRDMERITAANAWRTQRHQPLLPKPPPRGSPLPEKEALKIVSVQIEPAAGFQDTPLVKQALELRGSFFGPKMISSLLIRFAEEPPPGVSGLSIEALRESDLTGVVLHVHIVQGEFPKKENGQWNIFLEGQIGSQNLGALIDSDRPLSIARDADEWKSLEDKIIKGLKSPPTTAFSFYASLKASH